MFKNQAISKRESGFTLVELSIVLVIIGLIMGGVLAGQDLIKAARVRAQITQITQYNAATNTFHEKYAGLPGDLLSGANYFSGITNQGSGRGGGDGNGIIQAPGSANDYGVLFTGEPEIFWYELSKAGLIPDNTVATGGNYGWSGANIDGTVVPNGKISTLNISVYSGLSNGIDYWILASLQQTPGNPIWYPGLTPLQASQIDGKIDDGNPGTGKVFSIGEGGNGTQNPDDENPSLPGDPGNFNGAANYCTTTGNGTGAYNVVATPNSVNCEISIVVSF